MGLISSHSSGSTGHATNDDANGHCPSPSRCHGGPHRDVHCHDVHRHDFPPPLPWRAALAVTAVNDATKRATNKIVSTFFILLGDCFNIYSLLFYQT